MPRYFFVVQIPGQGIIDDSDGVDLESDIQAVAFAESMIRQIKAANDVGVLVGSAVKISRQDYGTVLTNPFFPGVA